MMSGHLLNRLVLKSRYKGIRGQVDTRMDRKGGRKTIRIITKVVVPKTYEQNRKQRTDVLKKPKSNKTIRLGSDLDLGR